MLTISVNPSEAGPAKNLTEANIRLESAGGNLSHVGPGRVCVCVCVCVCIGQWWWWWGGGGGGCRSNSKHWFTTSLEGGAGKRCSECGCTDDMCVCVCVCVCRGGGGGGGGRYDRYDFLFLLFGSATMTRLQSVSSAMSADGSERRRRNFFSRLAAAMEGRGLESIPRQERQDFSFPDWSAVRADNFQHPFHPSLIAVGA